MKTRTLFLAASLLAAGFHAQAQQPAGTAPCGIPVFVYQTGMGGMSTFHNGQPVILIDPQVAMGSAEIRDFTILHECGHHMSGHTLPQGLMARGFMGNQQELDADCYAAQRATRAQSRAMSSYFQNVQGPTSPAPGYPTGFQRAANIANCSGQGGGTPPPRRSNCPGLAPGQSLLCRFTQGPRAGQTQNFCGTGATPAPIGGRCMDGRGSFGIAQ